MSPSGKKEQPKEPRLPRSVRVSLKTRTIALPSNGLDPIPCPACESALAIHQPDPQWPEQLLGVCGACGEWYLLWVNKGETEALVMHLPFVSTVRRSLGIT
jgi:hypothetical protein